MDEFLRKLAKNDYWSSLYSRAKDLKLKLFNNETDFTVLQVRFLNWLEIYNHLYIELAMNEELLSKHVIEDDIRTDAYLLYKRKNKNDNNKRNIPNPNQEIPSFVFTTKRR